jgi:hypothetical protein
MALKWVSGLAAAAGMGMFVTANVVSHDIPIVVNLVLVATWSGGAILAVVAELYERLDSRLGVISDFLVTRLDELAGHLEVLDARTSGHGPDDVLAEDNSAVLPMAPRRNRPPTR